MLKKTLTSVAGVLLSFLLLPPVSPICRKGTVEECKKAELVPGGNFSGKGFDINTLTSPSPKYKEVINDTECTLCENPLLAGDPLQRLPLTISDWKANFSCEQKVHHSVHQSAISVAKALTELQVKNDWRKELDLKISSTSKFQWTLEGSRSEIARECTEKSSKDKYIFLLHRITCSFYKFRVSQPDSDYFTENVKLLPEKYDNNTNIEYFRLIRNYGTHFVTELDLGVHIFLMTPIPVCEAVLEDLSISELSLCIANDVGDAFGLARLFHSSDSLMCDTKKMKNMKFFNRLQESSVDILDGTIPSTSPHEWMESGKYSPTVISQSLVPLHTLVDKNNSRREGLRKAVSEYVKDHALWRYCSRPCPPGSHPSVIDFCSCECASNTFTNSMCCARVRGLARLIVTIDYAERLWGDYFTETDGYVTVSVSKKMMWTHTIWNSNHPRWDVALDFGVIQLYKVSNKLQLEVWDQDPGWNDDLLGDCALIMETGVHNFQECYLNHGRIVFKYHLKCSHNLVGSTCWNYPDPWSLTDSVHDYYHY